LARADGCNWEDAFHESNGRNIMTNPDEVRLNILRILEKEPEIAQRELAKRLGVSLGKTNYCLRALVNSGWVKAKNFKNNKDRSAYLYYLTPGGMKKKAELTKLFLKIKTDEYGELKSEIDRLYKELHGEG
jgi:EPS-associated MarR family transcriptional regulator